jgi:hypothetical protein
MLLDVDVPPLGQYLQGRRELIHFREPTSERIENVPLRDLPVLVSQQPLQNYLCGRNMFVITHHAHGMDAVLHEHRHDF